uniref:THD domain-containing protein n=1 Tax=Cyprinus carpio TaxID=7962 RepID=A0A8C1KIY5_CYPCA
MTHRYLFQSEADALRAIRLNGCEQAFIYFVYSHLKCQNVIGEKICEKHQIFSLFFFFLDNIRYPESGIYKSEYIFYTSVYINVFASPVSDGNGVLHWRADSFPVFMRGLEYKDNSLYVQQDGYYYIFSKIAHLENCNFFKHQVMQRTERYSSKAIELMQSSRFICVPNKSQWRGNSYLGGIFQLFKGDGVFVKVNNSSQVHGEVYENFFGAFMV